MCNTSLDEITKLGKDESLPDAPFSLIEQDYEQVLKLLYDILL